MAPHAVMVPCVVCTDPCPVGAWVDERGKPACELCALDCGFERAQPSSQPESLHDRLERDLHALASRVFRAPPRDPSRETSTVRATIREVLERRGLTKR
jgi:hypothetical protein